MPKIQANGIDIFYEVQVAGDPLLLIAGFACDHTIWSMVIPSLASQYRVIVFDNRGVGQSSDPDTAAGIRQMAEDAAGLLDESGWGRSMWQDTRWEDSSLRNWPWHTRSRFKLCRYFPPVCKLISWGRRSLNPGQLPRLVDAATGTRLILPWLYTSAFFAKPGAIEKVIDQILTNPFPPACRGFTVNLVRSARITPRTGWVNWTARHWSWSEERTSCFPLHYPGNLFGVFRVPSWSFWRRPGHGMLIESPDSVAKAMLDFCPGSMRNTQTSQHLCFHHNSKLSVFIMLSPDKPNPTNDWKGSAERTACHSTDACPTPTRPPPNPRRPRGRFPWRRLVQYRLRMLIPVLLIVVWPVWWSLAALPFLSKGQSTS